MIPRLLFRPSVVTSSRNNDMVKGFSVLGEKTDKPSSVSRYFISLLSHHEEDRHAGSTVEQI